MTTAAPKSTRVATGPDSRQAWILVFGLGLVMAISFGVTLRVFSGGLSLSRAAKDHTRMAIIARAKLSELLIRKDLKEGVIEGIEDGYAWRGDIRRFNEDNKLKINPEARILRVDVEVSEPGRDKGF